MFTEFVLAVEFAANTPTVVLDWLKFLIDPHDPMLGPVQAPTAYPLFRESYLDSPNYLNLFHGASTEFPGTSCVHLELQEHSQTYHLTIRAALQNNGREIESLLLYLLPYIRPLGYAGYFRASNEQFPSLILFPERGKLVVIDKIDQLIAQTGGVVRDLLGEEPDNGR